MWQTRSTGSTGRELQGGHVRYLVVLTALALFGCSDDPVEPRGLGPYEITSLRALPEGTDATFGDLNENGQALWHEGEQAVLWDNGSVLELPVGSFLGPSGEVLGASSLWRDGELIELPGGTEGIHEDGTVYISRNDTLFTWRNGTLAATGRPMGLVVGPEGRIWSHRIVWDEMLDVYVHECGFFLDGEWFPIGGRDRAVCSVEIVEENGWAIMSRGLNNESVMPGAYRILDDAGDPLDLTHVNSEGEFVAGVGILASPDGERLDLRDHFEGTIRLGAINDDGEILAQLDNEVVLLTLR